MAIVKEDLGATAKQEMSVRTELAAALVRRSIFGRAKGCVGLQALPVAPPEKRPSTAFPDLQVQEELIGYL